MLLLQGFFLAQYRIGDEAMKPTAEGVAGYLAKHG